MTIKEKNALDDIEKLINEPIPAVEFVNSFNFGFRAINGNVISLGLPDKGLVTLPESICHFSSIQDIVLFRNRLKILPESFSGLKSLKFLNLVDNRLSILPFSFNRLESLQNLYLNKNQLKVLPEDFGRLGSLQRLNLRNNQLRTLPASLSNLVNLESLWIRGNPLDEDARNILYQLIERGTVIDITDEATGLKLERIKQFTRKQQK